MNWHDDEGEDKEIIQKNWQTMLDELFEDILFMEKIYYARENLL